MAGKLAAVLTAALVVLFAIPAVAPAAAPDAVTGTATEITYHSATLNGTIDPNDEETDYRFEYGTTTAYGFSTFDDFIGSGSDPADVLAAVENLSPATTYHFRTVAVRGGIAVATGADQTFTTSPAPPPAAAVTSAATDVRHASATLNGSIDPNGAETNFYFEYGTTTSYGDQTSENFADSGDDPVPVSADLTGLAPSTLYHFRAVASRIGLPPVVGADLTFTTPATPPPPAVTTSAATAVTDESAILHGSIDPGSEPAEYYWEYGPTTSYGQQAGNDTSTISAAVQAQLTGLTPSTLFHFRLVGVRDGAPVSFGADLTFTTDAPHYISTPGKLTQIRISPELNCDVRYLGDSSPEFYGATACGTFIATGGTLFGPTGLPAGSGANPRSPYTQISQSAVSGTGTAGDPYKIVTTVDAGTTGLRITQTDTYVTGQESYRTDVKVSNTGGNPATTRIWRAADCYLQNSDSGWGAADSVSGAVSCVAGTPDTPGSRIEQWYPLSPGSHYYQAGFSEVWSRIGQQEAFPDTCQCNQYQDNGAGLSWDFDVPAGGSVTKSSLITFSPLGIQPLAVTKTSDSASTQSGGSNGYTITINNPNNTPVTLSSVADTLPEGFTYSPGSTTGATTSNPSIAGRDLTWSGPINVPAAGTATIHFGVAVSAVPGTYTNEASAIADGGFTIVPSGATAPVQVTPAAGTSLSIGDVTVTEGDSGTINANFPVTLSSASGSTVTVHAATSDVSAAAPGDYTAVSTDVTFAPGETSKNVAVPVKGDTIDEPNETFNVALSSPVNAGITDGTGVGTITDDDNPPSISISDVTVTEGNAGTVNATFVASLSGESGRTVTADYATADGSAANPADYTSASGGISFAPGETSKNVAVTVKGDTLDEIDETFALSLSNVVNASVADGSGTGTISDDDDPPAISVSDVSVTEGNSGTVEMTFSASLSAASGKTVSADFATADGAATQQADYASASGTVTFTPGQTSRPIVVTVNGDTIDELDETLSLTLSNLVNASSGDVTGTGTINDDDNPSLSIADASRAEGNSGESPLTFTISLSAASPQAVTVSLATSNGSAGAPGDYAAASTTVTIPAGQTSKTVDVGVKGDALDEPDETFNVTLSSPVNATLADASATGTIVDDDAPPAVSVSDVTVSEGNSGTVAASFTVSLSAASGQSLSVNFSTSNGTATSPGDYAAANGTVNFSPGDTTKTVAVTVNGDTVDEPDETFTVTLSSPVLVTLGDPTGTGTITDDDPPSQPPTGGGAIGQPDVSSPVKVDSICGVTKKKHGKVKVNAGRLDGSVKFTTAGKAAWDLFAEVPGKKGRGTTSFRLGKLAKKVRAGEVEFRITINRGRCKKLRRAVAKYGADRVKLRLTITLDPAAGPNVTRTTRIGLK